jgi:hypothetical protein
MKEYNKYVKKWQDLCIRLNEAMQKDDFDTADKLLEESESAYKRYKECCSYKDGNRDMTFGELNHMLESELPRMFKSDKEALKECTKLMKEDKNLRSAFRFIDSMRNYGCDGDAKSYVSESVKLVSDDIDMKTFKESVEKLADLLSAHEIGGYKLDEDSRKFYRACEKVLTEKKSLYNLTDYTNSINMIASYIEANKRPVNESRNTVQSISEELEKRIANLTEDEQSLVRDIIDSKRPMVEERQEKLFNNFRNECLDTVNKIIEGATEEDMEGLLSIKEQLKNKTYCKETIVQDIAKLLEIRDILIEK